MLVLPAFSEAEIWKLREVAFSGKPGCSEAEVAERFRKWGGTPRNVLTKGSDNGWQHDLETATAAVTVENMESALTYPGALFGVASTEQFHRLIKLVPRGAVEGSTLPPTSVDYYEFHHAEVMNPYVAGLIAESLMAGQRTELYHFLTWASAVPYWTGFCSTL